MGSLFADIISASNDGAFFIAKNHHFLDNNLKYSIMKYYNYFQGNSMIKKILSFTFILFIQIPLSAFTWDDLFNNRFIQIGTESKTVINGDIENSVINVGSGVTIQNADGTTIISNGTTHFTANTDHVFKINKHLIPVKKGDCVELSNNIIFINGKAAAIKKLSGNMTRREFQTSINESAIPSSIAHVYSSDNSYIECDSAVNDQIDFFVNNGTISARVKNNTTAYTVDNKTQSLCTVYAKILTQAAAAHKSK